MTRNIFPRQQRGTVLVTVLMMFAIATFLAAEMAYRQKLDVRRTSAMLLTEQAREYLLGAEELAKLALKDDFKSDQRNSTFVDSLNEDWASKRPPFPVDGGYIQGEIIDAQSKFNINDLVDPVSGTNTSNSATMAKVQFTKLLNALDVPKEGSATEVYEKIVDWMDANGDETGADGREDGAYLRGKHPHRTANRVIVDISELRAIDALGIENFNKLAPHIVALPPGTRKNINTAELELLDAMNVQNLSRLQTDRENKPVDSESAMAAYMLPDAQITSLYGNLGGKAADEYKKQFSIGSNYFVLRAKAVIGGRTVYSSSLLYRAPAPGPSTPGVSSGNSGKLEVIYRAYVDPLQQPMTPLSQ